MTSAFSADLRILTCPNCGAPLNVSPFGGQCACAHCRSRVDVEPRSEGLSRGPRLTEDERVKGLWRQAEEYRNVVMQHAPVVLAELLNAGTLTDDRVSQALTMWQAYCEQAKDGDTRAAEYALLLTGSIQNYFAALGDLERMRALFETTMEALPSPSHKDVLRCRLARAALRVGDIDSCKAWLAGCDPEPADLEADSDYRLTCACLATVEHDFRKVLAVLGPTLQSTPVAVAPSVMIDIVRANAVEKTGDVPSAVDLLLDTIRERQETPEFLLHLAAANPWLELCSQSLRLAAERCDSSVRARDSATAPDEGPTRRGLFGRHKP